MTARVIQVIETSLERRGAGTRQDPIRVITQYWTTDGTLLAEHDPMPPVADSAQPTVTATETVTRPAS